MQLHVIRRPISRRGRKLGLNVDMVHGLFKSVDLVQLKAFRRLLGGRLAFVTATDGLRVALDYHRLEGWDLLLVIGLVDVGRWRVYAEVLGLVVVEVV